jgi:hypothetical protein
MTTAKKPAAAADAKVGVPVVKTGKTHTTTRVTSETVQRLERAGSWESAKIAREFVKP